MRCTALTLATLHGKGNVVSDLVSRGRAFIGKYDCPDGVVEELCDRIEELEAHIRKHADSLCEGYCEDLGKGPVRDCTGCQLMKGVSA